MKETIKKYLKIPAKTDFSILGVTTLGNSVFDGLSDSWVEQNIRSIAAQGANFVQVFYVSGNQIFAKAIPVTLLPEEGEAFEYYIIFTEKATVTMRFKTTDSLRTILAEASSLYGVIYSLFAISKEEYEAWNWNTQD